MSSKGDGGGGGGGAEGSRVSIPDNAKKTILSIREITGKQHSDEEIYAILKECSMDPNETAQKLLYMGQEKSASNLNTTSTSATSPIVSRDSVAVDTIQSELGLQQEAAELNRIQGNKHIPWDMDISKTEKMVSEVSISMHGEEPSKSEVAEQVKQSMPVEQVTSEVAAVTDKANPQLLADSNVRNGQHVIFPTHFQVSEALKNGLTFGSFDASFGQVSKHNNVTDLEINSARPVETSLVVDETVGEPSSSSQGILPAGEGGNADQQQAPCELEKVTESDGNVSSDTNLKVDQSNHEMHLHLDNNQSTIPNVPSYGLGFVPASMTNVPQFDGPEARPHDVSHLTNFISGNPPAPSGSSTPPIQSSVAAAPQAVHLFRQPFPPNYFPYPHYLSPFYMHPMHQFLNPTGLPQQPSTGNVYMAPGATPPGVKFPLPQFKPGTNAGNPAHLAIPSGYGPLTSPPIGFNLPLPSVTSGSSSSNEDIAALQFKENQIYTTGPLNEGSALWMPAPGQDLSNLQVNSLYNLPLHGPQLPFSPAQAGHGAFAGLYQSLPQTMAAPSNVNTLLQQSQSTAAAVGSVGPPSGTYQQPQLAQVNWKTNY
ncbi:hypothetical protein V6Z11_A13G153300 [Gossypium hirsutum]